MSTPKVGDLVVIGQRYQMAEHPPYLESRGTHVDDQWTGTVWRVVGLVEGNRRLAPNLFSGAASAILAFPDIKNPTLADEECSPVLSRLTVIEPCLLFERGGRFYRR